MKHFYLMLLLLLLPMSGVQAQDEITAKPIFSFLNATQESSSNPRIIFGETEWQMDSQSFDIRSTMPNGRMIFHYDIPTNGIQMNDVTYPCVYTFTSEQSKLFGEGCSRTISPNGRYVLYATGEYSCSDGCVYKLAIADLKTETHAVIQAWFAENYYVRWSENSSAFLILDIGDLGGLGGISHVSVPQLLPATTEVPSTMLANYSPPDPGYIDISPDGQQVLIRGVLNSGIGLTLWNTSLPSSHQQFAAWFDGITLIKDQVIGGATFLPDDPEHILVVTPKGIIKYDLKTHSSTVINTQINSVFPNWVYFSSDVRYALVYTLFPDDLNKQQITLFQLN